MFSSELINSLDNQLVRRLLYHDDMSVCSYSECTGQDREEGGTDGVKMYLRTEITSLMINRFD